MVVLISFLSLSSISRKLSHKNSSPIKSCVLCPRLMGPCWFGPMSSRQHDLQQYPAQCPSRVLLQTTLMWCQTAKLFSSRLCSPHLVPSSPPVMSLLSLGVPATTIISFSSHNVEVIHKKNILEPGYGTAKTDISPSLWAAWRGFPLFY